MPVLKSTGLKHVHRHLRGFKRQDSRRAINSLKFSESFIVKKQQLSKRKKWQMGNIKKFIDVAVRLGLHQLCSTYLALGKLFMYKPL